MGIPGQMIEYASQVPTAQVRAKEVAAAYREDAKRRRRKSIIKVISAAGGLTAASGLVALAKKMGDWYTTMEQSTDKYAKTVRDHLEKLSAKVPGMPPIGDDIDNAITYLNQFSYKTPREHPYPTGTAELEPGPIRTSYAYASPLHLKPGESIDSALDRARSWLDSELDSGVKRTGEEGRRGFRCITVPLKDEKKLSLVRLLMNRHYKDFSMFFRPSPRGDAVMFVPAGEDTSAFVAPAQRDTLHYFKSVGSNLKFVQDVFRKYPELGKTQIGPQMKNVAQLYKELEKMSGSLNTMQRLSDFEAGLTAISKAISQAKEQNKKFGQELDSLIKGTHEANKPLEQIRGNFEAGKPAFIDKPKELTQHPPSDVLYTLDQFSLLLKRQQEAINKKLSAMKTQSSIPTGDPSPRLQLMREADRYNRNAMELIDRGRQALRGVEALLEPGKGKPYHMVNINIWKENPKMASLVQNAITQASASVRGTEGSLRQYELLKESTDLVGKVVFF